MMRKALPLVPNPAPNERVCFNCEHLIWGVALGIGVLCRHPAKVAVGRPFRVPNRRYSCEHFEGHRDTSSRPVVVTGTPIDDGTSKHDL